MAAVTYAFLCDENAMHLAELFPAGRAKTVADFGMLGASDPEVMRKADDDRRILVSSNRDDFKELFVKHAAQGGRKKCTDLYGLVLFAGEKGAQLRIPIRELGSRLRLDGKRIGWSDVHYQNLLVRVMADGRVRVERLPRCPYCMTP